MSALTAVYAALAGYLLGSISFARVVSRILAPRVNIVDTKVVVPGRETAVEWRPISASTASMHLGGRVGCAIALLDMLKVALPALAFKLLYPGQPYELIVAVAGMAGHNWPIFHRFRGGRGLSTFYGGPFAIDWLGALVTSTLGTLLGMVVVRDMLVAYLAGLWLVIPWMWIRTQRVEYVAYAVAVNVLVMVAMIPDIKDNLKLKREGVLNQEMMMQAVPMGRGMLKMQDQIQALLKWRPSKE